jgi:serine/threonine protein kinase
MTKPLPCGTKIGRWKIRSKPMRGGNGEVYAVSDGKHNGALKRLRGHGLKSDAAGRFHTEIATMKACADVPGVMRVLDSFLAPDPSRSWFVTDYAQAFLPKLRNAHFDDIIGAVRAIGTTLATLHSRGVSHRDVKPENLFWCNDAWMVGDLGLVSTDDGERYTRAGTKLGPLHYMAPEMMQDASSADGRAADVYSLAKVLWVAATGQRYPMPGHLNRDVSQLRVSSLISGVAALRLDAVLHAATHPDPPQRPKMSEMVAELATLQPLPVEELKMMKIRPELLRGLSERSGLAQRMEQAEANSLGSRMENRVSSWLKARFDPVLSELKEALESAEGLEISGGRLVHPGGLDLSSPGGVPKPSEDRLRYELSAFGSIRGAASADFAFGICLDLIRTEVRHADGGFLMPVDTLPAVVTAAYVSGHLRVKAALNWSLTEVFLIDGVNDEAACRRLSDGLRGQLENFVEHLLDQTRNIG